MRKLLQRLWDIAADFANFMGGLGMRLVWLPKLHFSPGAEQVRTDPGPALFVLNHSWWMDAPMLCLLCRRRRISVVAAGEMFTGVRSLAMRSLRCIPVDRATGADLSFFHEALRRLRAGRCVAIFPEGRSTRRKRSWRSSRARRCWPCRPGCRSSPSTARGIISRSSGCSPGSALPSC